TAALQTWRLTTNQLSFLLRDDTLPRFQGGFMIACNHADAWLTGTEDVVRCTPLFCSPRRWGFTHRPCPRGIRPLASGRRTHP
ncbi:unnamed protein product, partial [Ectocarpus sp. 4 AP-2014]